MNPEKVSVSEVCLQNPQKRSTGKITYCLLPCTHNDQRFQLKLQTKFKIFAHEGNSFSLGITLPEKKHFFFPRTGNASQCRCSGKTGRSEKTFPFLRQVSRGRFYSLENRQIRAGEDLRENLSLQNSKHRFLLSILGVNPREKETHPESERTHRNSTQRSSRFFHQTSFLRKCQIDHMHRG